MADDQASGILAPFRRDFDNARDPFTARNALGIPSNTDIAARFNNVVVQAFTASGTYTPTPGMKFAIIECIAGGAAGGGLGGTATFLGSAGGGGAGGYSRVRKTTAEIGASQAVTVGAGGTGVSNAAGNNGNDTSVGSLCVAKGGTGGQGGAAATYGGGAGGVAGTGSLVAAGGAGSPGFFNSNAATTVYAFGGKGGDSAFGGGAAAVSNSAAGTYAGIAGSNYGGGGSAAFSNQNNANAAGGAGAAGFVIITEFIGG